MKHFLLAVAALIALSVGGASAQAQNWGCGPGYHHHHHHHGYGPRVITGYPAVSGFGGYYRPSYGGVYSPYGYGGGPGRNFGFYFGW